jgi:hypothetical protein
VRAIAAGQSIPVLLLLLCLFVFPFVCVFGIVIVCVPSVRAKLCRSLVYALHGDATARVTGHPFFLLRVCPSEIESFLKSCAVQISGIVCSASVLSSGLLHVLPPPFTAPRQDHACWKASSSGPRVPVSEKHIYFYYSSSCIVIGATAISFCGEYVLFDSIGAWTSLRLLHYQQSKTTTATKIARALADTARFSASTCSPMYWHRRYNTLMASGAKIKTYASTRAHNCRGHANIAFPSRIENARPGTRMPCALLHAHAMMVR